MRVAKGQGWGGVGGLRRGGEVAVKGREYGVGLITRGGGKGGVAIDFWVTVYALVTDIPLTEQAFIHQ